jgi:hypothetical protein
MILLLAAERGVLKGVGFALGWLFTWSPSWPWWSSSPTASR